jgi:hypothetical protein
MLTSINFDDQARLEADEVDDVGADRVLSAKLRSHHAMRSQLVPQTLLCIGRLGAQGASETSRWHRGWH